MERWLREFLKDEAPTISSVEIRRGCGNPAAETWSKWRKTCNITTMEGRSRTRPKLLSRRDAVLLICRSQWMEIKAWLRDNLEEFDRPTREAAEQAIRKVSPDYFDLEQLGLLWFADRGRLLQSTPPGVIAPSDQWEGIEGRDLARAIREITGKPLSESTIRSRCAILGWKYGRGTIYNYGQVLLIAQVS